MVDLFKTVSKDGYVRIKEEEDYLVLSQGIPRTDGKIVDLPNEYFTDKDSLVKEINYNLISERRLSESEFNFLMIENSGVLEREHLYSQIFFHSDMKKFITDIIINKMRNNEINGVSYYFFENTPKEHLISHIESMDIRIETGQVVFRFSSLLDGKLNELILDIDKVEGKFEIGKLLGIIEDLAEESVRYLTLYFNANLMNHAGKWYLERTPLVFKYMNYYSGTANFLSTYKIFDSNKWENDIKKFVKVKDYIKIK